MFIHSDSKKEKNLNKLIFPGAKIVKLICINFSAMITPLLNETKRVTDVFFEVMRGKEEGVGEKGKSVSRPTKKSYKDC